MQELRKNREIQLNQQTIRCQVLADMIKIWSCLIFIKLYEIFSVYLLDNMKIGQVSLGFAKHSIQPLNPCDQGTHCRNLCILQYLGWIETEINIMTGT